MTETAPMVFFFIPVLLLIGTAINRNSIPKVPYTVSMFLVGMLLGTAVIIQPNWEQYVAFSQIPVNYIFYIYLPILIFQGAFEWEPRIFRKVFVPSFILAFPGIIINTVLMGFVGKFLYPEWSMVLAFLYGSVISATDPIATISLLRELGGDKYITGIIEGEAMLNDGSSICMYILLLPLASTGISLSFGSLILQSLQLVLGATLLGIIIGGTMVYILEHIYDDPVSEISVTLTFSFIAYYLADYVLGVSGVLTLVTLGICFSYRRYAITPSSAGSLNTFWQFMVHSWNTILFANCGYTCIKDGVVHTHLHDFFLLFIFAICLTVVRCLMVGALWPIIRISFPLTWNGAAMISFSGLRGAVALTLSIVLKHNESLPPRVRQAFLFLTSGMVIINTIINGCSGSYVIEYLNMNKKNSETKKMLNVACQKISSCMDSSMNQMKVHKDLFNSDWVAVRKFTKYSKYNPYANDVTSSTVNDEELGRSIYLRGIRKGLFDLHNQGIITFDSFYALLSLVESYIEDGRILTFQDVKSSMSFTSFILSSSNKFSILLNQILIKFLPGARYLLKKQEIEMTMVYRLAMRKLQKSLPEATIPNAIKRSLVQFSKTEFETAEEYLFGLLADSPDIGIGLTSKMCTHVILNKSINLLHDLESKGELAIEDSSCVAKFLKKMVRESRNAHFPHKGRCSETQIKGLEIFDALNESELNEIFSSSSLTQYGPGNDITLASNTVTVVLCGIINFGNSEDKSSPYTYWGEGITFGLFDPRECLKQAFSFDITIKAVTNVEVVSFPKSIILQKLSGHSSKLLRYKALEVAPYAYFKLVKEYSLVRSSELFELCCSGVITDFTNKEITFAHQKAFFMQISSPDASLTRISSIKVISSSSQSEVIQNNLLIIPKKLEFLPTEIFDECLAAHNSDYLIDINAEPDTPSNKYKNKALHEKNHDLVPLYEN